MLTPEQCRAARGLLGWDKATLAEKASVSIVTLSKFEAGTRSPYRGTLTLLRQCLDAAGVEFIDENGGGAGVRLKKRRGAK
jgi:transcriptional regulator with XRE-family HTH domain